MKIKRVEHIAIAVQSLTQSIALMRDTFDNRFQRGRFSPDDADLLGAFADQIAVALHNGRLMAELRERTRALEEEQRTRKTELKAYADAVRTVLLGK